MTASPWRGRSLAGLLCLTAQLGGCGTMLMTTSLSATGESALRNGCNVTRFSPCKRIPHVYAGVSYDACTVGSLFTALPRAVKDDPVPALLFAPAFVGFAVLATADLPLSTVADTFSLPWSVPKQSERGDACPVGWTPIPPYERNLPPNERPEGRSR